MNEPRIASKGVDDVAMSMMTAGTSFSQLELVTGG